MPSSAPQEAHRDLDKLLYERAPELEDFFRPQRRAAVTIRGDQAGRYRQNSCLTC